MSPSKTQTSKTDKARSLYCFFAPAAAIATTFNICAKKGTKFFLESSIERAL